MAIGFRTNMRRDGYGSIVQDSAVDEAFRGEYDGSNNLIYAGYGQPGTTDDAPKWQIQKLTYSGSNLLSIEWPQVNGVASNDYQFIWNNRASYTYS